MRRLVRRLRSKQCRALDQRRGMLTDAAIGLSVVLIAAPAASPVQGGVSHDRSIPYREEGISCEDRGH
jgi:hypothetical protein